MQENKSGCFFLNTVYLTIGRKLQTAPTMLQFRRYNVTATLKALFKKIKLVGS